ncbi:MAG: TonB C-terminal domain-containing protein [Desulfovibrio sp.]|jgi:TonB family protein|nr:TonB C-terminal domain-containing protein [Desulfovibrio sp.]
MPLLFLLTALFFAVQPSYGASMAAVDVNEGYGSNILNRLNAVWAPPNLKGDFKLRMKIAVDGEGKVRECAIVRSSGMESLDASACGAVRQIRKFDTPPYGVPCEVYVSFWTGLPKGNTRESPPDPMQALRAEMIERDRFERAVGKQRADAAEERAREKAEQAAKRTGKPLPEAQPPPADPPMPQRRDKAAEQRPAPALTAEELRLEMPGMAGNAAPQLQSPLPRTGQGAPPVAAASPAQTTSGKKMEKYLSNIHWRLLNAIIVPAETKPGVYQATVRLHINADGGVANCELVKDTGDGLLDKYVLRGIRRAGDLPPPPPAFGNPVDLTFKLRRR